jgi:hypothetical protein
MRRRGIHYDIGTTTIDGDSTRPTLERERMEREIRDIVVGLHATAIRITGGDTDRIAAAATIGGRHDLELWLSPMLPNADESTTLSAIEASAADAEALRRDGHAVVLVVGCESSVFTFGILPGETHADRLGLLLDQERLVAAVTAAGTDPQARFAEFIALAVDRARTRFAGPLSYAAGTWEQVDWSRFDIVGVDAYRDAGNRTAYIDQLRERVAGGAPVVVTEVGCATYRGAAERGAMAWTAVDSASGARRVREGIRRDEAAQAAELDELMAAIETSGADGMFVYTYIAPSYPSDPVPALDLDAASFALVRSWPGGRSTPKAAYRTVADRFARSTRSIRQPQSAIASRRAS